MRRGGGGCREREVEEEGREVEGGRGRVTLQPWAVGHTKERPFPFLPPSPSPSTSLPLSAVRIETFEKPTHRFSLTVGIGREGEGRIFQLDNTSSNQ